MSEFLNVGSYETSGFHLWEYIFKEKGLFEIPKIKTFQKLPALQPNWNIHVLGGWNLGLYVCMALPSQNIVSAWMHLGEGVAAVSLVSLYLSLGWKHVSEMVAISLLGMVKLTTTMCIWALMMLYTGGPIHVFQNRGVYFLAFEHSALTIVCKLCVISYSQPACGGTNLRW